MRKILTLLALLPIALQAQVGQAVLETSGARLQIPVNGQLFNNVANQAPGYEVPLGSGRHTLYTSSLWVGGIAGAGELRQAGLLYCNNSTTEAGFCEYYPGPLKTDDGTTTEEVMDQYNRLWIVNKSQSDNHIAYFDCQNDPDCDTNELFPDGYEVPEVFLEWPAHGDVAQGYAADLAPFIDTDDDGEYNPDNGDYPDFCGDYAAYLILNDAGLHFETISEPIGLEIHTMVYAFADEGAIGQSVFVRQKLINRSLEGLESTYIGVWNDFDIGDYSDDFVGTDVERSMVYGYNGNQFDLQYGDDLPAMGCLILSGPLADPNDTDDEMPYEGYEKYGRYASGWGDGIVDNETIGLNSSMAIYGSGPVDIQTPDIGPEYYSYLRGHWRSTAPMVHGGFGYHNPEGDLLETRYVFPGSSDPMHDGTDGVDPGDGPEGWTEETANSIASDRRALASMGPFSFEAGSEEVIEYAYVFAQQSQDLETPLLTLLGQNADAVLEHQCELNGDITTGINRHEDQVEFLLYPNPSQGLVTLKLPDNIQGTYSIINIVGQEIEHGLLQFPSTSINLGAVPNGMYLVKVTRGNQIGFKRILVEK